ncbi:hypothetical protein ACN47E_005708 [Coniothyrium glycines]
MAPAEPIMYPLPWIFLLFCLVLYLTRKDQIWQLLKKKPVSHLNPNATSTQKTEPLHSEDAYYNIEPLPDFDLATTHPLKLRPFKPKFHMTMALEKTTLSSLIEMDNTYPSRIALRSSLLQSHHSSVLALTPRSHAAVLELATWLLSTYLPSRFPTLFTLQGPATLLNRVTGALLPVVPASAVSALEILGQNIDTDFLILLPGERTGDDDDDGGEAEEAAAGRQYTLEAFITCFPSGFHTPSKLGRTLSEIHAPVPRYKTKLARSMDRYFAALPLGTCVRRLNWTVTTTPDLFCLAGSHMTPAEAQAQAQAQAQLPTAARRQQEAERVRLAKTSLRCERQTLHRLPVTKAVVFAFKTYQYPVQELRDEGSGEALAEAIEGIATGSVPEMTVYKRQVVWGDKVKAFLRGEIEA